MGSGCICVISCSLESSGTRWLLNLDVLYQITNQATLSESPSSPSPPDPRIALPRGDRHSSQSLHAKADCCYIS